LIAEQTTIKKGFIIVRAGGKSVKSVDDSRKQLKMQVTASSLKVFIQAMKVFTNMQLMSS
jgi:hypothetical protein